MSGDLHLANARLVLPDQVILGQIEVADGRIAAISEGGGVPAGAIDCAGDFVMPGLVELHTDNLERHIVRTLRQLARVPIDKLVAHRYDRWRRMGRCGRPRGRSGSRGRPDGIEEARRG